MVQIAFFISLTFFLTTFLMALPGEATPMEKKLSEYGFEKIGEEKGTVVFKHSAKDIVRVAAETVFDASVDEVARQLVNYKGQMEIVGSVSECIILDQGKNWINVYQHLDLPVISDRDYTLNVTMGKDNEISWIHYIVNPEIGPSEKDGIVRVRNHQGTWQLKSIDGGKKTFLRFQVSIDMAGWLPKWLYRSGAASELPDLLDGIRTLVKMEQSKISGK